MNLPVQILVTAAALLAGAASGAPLEEDFNSNILMPGERPIIYEVDNGEASGVSYNGEPSTNLLPSGSIVGRPSILREVGGRLCGLSFGTIIFNGSCERLLTQSVCSEGEWLVKRNNNNDDDEGECVPRPCPGGQLHYEGLCVNVSSDKSVCNDGQMLYVDLTGHVHCDCEPHYFYDPWVGTCFTQHDKGSCNFGKHLQVTQGGVVECVPNPCVMEGFYHSESTGKCYQKMYRGICEDPYHVILHDVNMTAECFTTQPNTIFDLPTLRSCAPGSRRDYARICRELFRVPAETVYPTTSYRTCRLGFVKDPRGTCRKTHKLFG